MLTVKVRTLFISPEQFAERLKNWVNNPGSDSKLEIWYNNTARQYLKQPGGIFTMVTKFISGPKRYSSSQQEIDDILRSELKNIKFSAKATYNPRLRAAGKITAIILPPYMEGFQPELKKLK